MSKTAWMWLSGFVINGGVIASAKAGYDPIVTCAIGVLVGVTVLVSQALVEDRP